MGSYFPEKFDVEEQRSCPNGHEQFLAVERRSCLVEAIQGCKLLDKYKKQAVAVLFVILEAISFVLDLVGKSKLSFLVAALLLSTISFAITIYINCIIDRSRSQLQAHHCDQRQLRVVVEIVFSMVQLFVTCIHLILVNLDIKNYYDASIFPLVFAIIVLVFIFKKDDEKDSITEGQQMNESKESITTSHQPQDSVSNSISLKKDDEEVIPTRNESKYSITKGQQMNESKESITTSHQPQDSVSNSISLKKDDEEVIPTRYESKDSITKGQQSNESMESITTSHQPQDSFSNNISRKKRVPISGYPPKRGQVLRRVFAATTKKLTFSYMKPHST